MDSYLDMTRLKMLNLSAAHHAVLIKGERPFASGLTYPRTISTQTPVFVLYHSE